MNKIVIGRLEIINKMEGETILQERKDCIIFDRYSSGIIAKYIYSSNKHGYKMDEAYYDDIFIPEDEDKAIKYLMKKTKKRWRLEENIRIYMTEMLYNCLINGVPIEDGYELEIEDEEEEEDDD